MEGNILDNDINKIKDKDLEKGLEKLVVKHEIDKRLIVMYKDMVKAKEDYKKGKLSRAEIDKIRKESRLFMRTLIDYVQFKKAREIDPVTIHM